MLKVGISIKETETAKMDRYGIRGKRSLAMVGAHGDTLSAIIQANVTYYNNSSFAPLKRWKASQKYALKPQKNA